MALEKVKVSQLFSAWGCVISAVLLTQSKPPVWLEVTGGRAQHQRQCRDIIELATPPNCEQPRHFLEGKLHIVVWFVARFLGR